MIKYKRLPEHIGIIPDGNRRWAEKNGLPKEQGYFEGVKVSKHLYNVIANLGVKEVSVYCFTKENMRRNKFQVMAFVDALLEIVEWLKNRDYSILVVGDDNSKAFPSELKKYTTRDGVTDLKLNLLVNYNWKWDVRHYRNYHQTGSHLVSRIDLIIRWGNRCRLSGFLPLQSAYSDIYIIKELFPEFKESHVYDALKWYEKQDVTLGG